MSKRTNKLCGIHSHNLELGRGDRYAQTAQYAEALSHSLHYQLRHIRTARKHMIVAINPVNRVREWTDPRDMSFLLGIHVGSQRTGEPCAAEYPRDFPYARRA